MDRRQYLRAVGSATAIGIASGAGCAGPSDGGDGGEDGGDGTETEPPGGATATETAAETDATGTEETGTAEPETDATETEETGTAETGTDGGAAAEVRMVTDGSEYYFDPIGLHVEPGETVTWINESGAHSSTAYEEGNQSAETTRIPEGAEGWNSGTLTEEGATFEHTFETEGTYDYFCIPHKSLGMVGRIVVGEPGGPATEGQPPDGSLPDSQTIVDQGSVGWDEFSE